MSMPVNELLGKYKARKKAITERLSEFSREKGDKELYAELAFCMLTPQS